MKITITAGTLILPAIVLYACNICRPVYGEEELGSRFTFVNESNDKKYILYCTSEYCCTSGFNVIPSKVVKVGYDSHWVIVESIDKNAADHYWIIDKAFSVDLTKCNDVSCDSTILAHVKGPLSRNEFDRQKLALAVTLQFEEE